MAKETSPFVKKLAHNDDRVRRQAFEALKQFLQSKAAANLDQFEYDKLWKGLYFSMWFCDKPIPQQNLAHDLGTLFSEYVPQSSLRRFHTAFWRILAREWYSIDKWRLDKYLMLVRRVFRHMLFRLQAHGWPEAEIKEFFDVLLEKPLSGDPKTPAALGYHVCDLFVDEIEYVVLKDFRDYSEEVDEDDEDESEEESEDEEDEDSGDENGDESDKKGQDSEKTDSDAKDAETEAKKAKVLSETPLSLLVQPFRTLAETTKSEPLKKKCKEEILDDDRLVEWGVTEVSQKNDESDDEWTGF